MSNPPQPDRDEILRAVRRIAAPDQVVELRALNVLLPGRSRPVTLSGYFDDLERLVAEAARIRGAQGIYITLNPPDPAVLARCANRVRGAGVGAATSDADIVARRWLPIDADPIRPAEISASEVEHDAALGAARRIRAALAEPGWPEPLLADSGNGGHLLYLVELPRDDDGLVERVLAALAARFDDDRVRVDVKVYNPARIWKLYGTVACKGDHTPDRPHRLARILEAPKELTPVPRRLLEELGRYHAGAVTAHGDAAKGRGISIRNPQSNNPQFSLDSWLAAHNVPAGPVEPWQGGRRWVFPVCPWNPDHLRSAYIVELPGGAIAAGCHHNSCAGKGWRELRQLYGRGLRNADLKIAAPQSAAPFGRDVDHARHPTGTLSAVARPQSEVGNIVPEQLRDLQSAILSWPAVKDRTERAGAEERASALVQECAGLDRSGLLQVAAALRARGLSAGFIRQWLAAVRELARRTQAAANAALAPDDYEAEGGRIYRVAWELTATGEPQPRRSVVADFALNIVEETVAEDGRVWFTLAGEAADGRPLRLELTAAEFADDRMLQVAVTAAAGSRCPVRANMLRHLRPAIQLLTPGEVPRARRYERTGWVQLRTLAPAPRAGVADLGLRIENTSSLGNDAPADPQHPGSTSPEMLVEPGSDDSQYPAGTMSTINNAQYPAGAMSTIRKPQFFLIPGREPAGVVVRLPRKLPYRVEPGGDLAQGLAALESALNAADPRRTTILVAAMLGAPMARRAGLEGERYGVFLSGRTGSLKTSTAQALMCLFGAGFIEDQYLLKLGEGATRNALMGYAAHVHDLPLLVDNFKPSTGDGARGFVNLLHNLLEGGDRDRLTRTAELRESRPVYCWPVFTGEDVPDADTAGLARLLIVPFEPPRAEDARLEALGRAQALAAHLPAVGEAWLAWLEGAGAAAAVEDGSRFPGMRARWLEHLRGLQAESANPLRVASSLACNELAWDAMRRCPELGALAERFADAHLAGLLLTAEEMGGRTVVSLEAARFLAVLRELLATGRCELMAKGGGRTPVGNDAAGNSLRWATAAEDRYPPGGTGSSADGRPGRGRNTPQGADAGSTIPERTLGWECPDGSIYLLPELARREVERVLGPGGLNGISSRTLHEQLSELGMIAGHDRDRLTRKIRQGGRTHNVLHLRPDALEG
jgi:hypothetical protein